MGKAAMGEKVDIDARMMHACLHLAERGAGMVSPNPMVGAVLVKAGRMVSAGYHRAFGGPHAEVECLRRYRGDPAGATLYVNLEPCAHRGKTPPCTDLIIRSGIRRVVVGMKDPNPLVAGRGLAALRRAGIRVTVGVMEREARELNRSFAVHIRHRRPYVHLKMAQSLDGRIAGPEGKTLGISGHAAQRLVHGWRARYDAVLVGAGTVLADDPRLDVRHVRGRNPDVVILDGRLRVPPDARVFRDTTTRRVFVCTSRSAARAHARVARELSLAGITVLTFPAEGHHVELKRVLRELYRHLIGSLLVEGGSEVFTEFLRAGRVDELSIFVAPRLLPGGLPAFAVKSGLPGMRAVCMDACMVGTDILVRARFGSRRHGGRASARRGEEEGGA